MGTPLCSVVVLCYNRPEYTAATLEALCDVPSGVEREIIAVDNGSDAPTRDLLRTRYDAGQIDKLVHVPTNLGTSPGFNLGFAVSDPGSRYLSKLDNDIVVTTPGWLAELCAIFDDVPGTGIVSTEIENHSGVTDLPAVELGGHRLRNWMGWVAGGGGMTFPRELYARLGGFSTAFPSELKLMPDDLEYFHRVHKAGYSAYYVCAARSRHQTHLDEEYQAYGRFKDRQYHLLGTRFFRTARTRGAYSPWIIDAEVSPTQAAPGQVVRLRARVNAHAAEDAGLGMSIRRGEGAPWQHDPPGDQLLKLEPGTQVIEREFQLAKDLAPGDYDVSIGLYDGQPGASNGHDSLVQAGVLKIKGRRRPAAPRARKGPA